MSFRSSSFFLALFGIVDAKFLMKHIRYAILIIFVIAAVICPTPDPVGMTLFAMPMLILYMSVSASPSRASCKTQAQRGKEPLMFRLPFAALLGPPLLHLPAQQRSATRLSGADTYTLTQQFLNAAPRRWIGSEVTPGQRSF